MVTSINLVIQIGITSIMAATILWAITNEGCDWPAIYNGQGHFGAPLTTLDSHKTYPLTGTQYLEVAPKPIREVTV